MAYNGWANYATWRVNLEIFDGFEPDGQRVSADYLEEYADDLLTMDGDRNRLAIDYARAFMQDVDWQEIADHINSDHDLEEED